jgi:hypothetical protein
MKYESFSQFLVPNGSGVLAADALDTAAVHGEYVCVRGCDLRRLLAVVTELTAQDATSSVISFKKRTAPGVTAGEITLGTITIGHAVAVGQVFVNDVSPKDSKLSPGQALAFEVTTAGVDAGAEAGEVLYGFECIEKTEDYREESNTNSVTA